MSTEESLDGCEWYHRVVAFHDGSTATFACPVHGTWTRAMRQGVLVEDEA